MPLDNQKRWIALYVKSRTEFRTHDELLAKGINSFLPIVKELRQWSDRKKWVEAPLFRSYLFVQITQKEYLYTLQTNGVMKAIHLHGAPIIIPDAQIEAVKEFLTQQPTKKEETDAFEVGEQVAIIKGPMCGLNGTLILLKGKQRVELMIDAINQTIRVELPKSFLEKLVN